MTVRTFLALTIAGVLAGCGTSDAPPRAEPADVTGTVTLADGKPAAGLTLILIPYSKGTLQAQFNLDKQGKFTGKAYPGDYVYFFEPGTNAAAHKALPGALQTANENNKVTVKAGEPVTIAVK